MDQKETTPNQDILDAIIAPDGLYWIKKHAPELEGLPEDFVLLIVRFTFLWMIFEGKALGELSKCPTPKKKCPTPKKIVTFSKKLCDSRHFDADIFCCALEHFRKRYVDCKIGETSYRFDILFPEGEGKFKKGCHYELIECVLLDKNALLHQWKSVLAVLLDENALLPQWRRVSAVLMVVYRYRNLLFHGPKWLQNHLPNQCQNFVYANNILKHAIELNTKLLLDSAS